MDMLKKEAFTDSYFKCLELFEIKSVCSFTTPGTHLVQVC